MSLTQKAAALFVILRRKWTCFQICDMPVEAFAQSPSFPGSSAIS
jgi:hypothetical protein